VAKQLACRDRRTYESDEPQDQVNMRQCLLHRIMDAGAYIRKHRNYLTVSKQSPWMLHSVVLHTLTEVSEDFTAPNIPEDSHLHNRCRENLKSRLVTKKCSNTLVRLILP
jgi:hypothetical protein